MVRLASKELNTIASPKLFTSIAIAYRLFDLQAANDLIDRFPAAIRGVRIYYETFDANIPGGYKAFRRRMLGWIPFGDPSEDAVSLTGESPEALRACEFHIQRKFTIYNKLCDEYQQIMSQDLHTKLLKKALGRCPNIRSVYVRTGRPSRMLHVCSCSAVEAEQYRRHVIPWKGQEISASVARIFANEPPPPACTGSCDIEPHPIKYLDDNMVSTHRYCIPWIGNTPETKHWDEALVHVVQAHKKSIIELEIADDIEIGYGVGPADLVDGRLLPCMRSLMPQLIVLKMTLSWDRSPDLDILSHEKRFVGMLQAATGLHELVICTRWYA